VEIRIRPEPEDRDALQAAVEELLSRDPLPSGYRSGWRLRGVLENVGEDESQEEAGLPLSSPGATRA
jgi:hypothetical protein